MKKKFIVISEQDFNVIAFGSDCDCSDCNSSDCPSGDCCTDMSDCTDCSCSGGGGDCTIDCSCSSTGLYTDPQPSQFKEKPRD